MTPASSSSSRRAASSSVSSMRTKPPGSAHACWNGCSLRWISRTLRSVSSRPNTTQSTASAGRAYSYEKRHRSAFPIATYARISASSRSKPPDRIGNRHHDRGSTLRSSRWKDGAMRSRFHWLRHHSRKNRSIHVASCAGACCGIARQQLLQHLDRRVLVADRRVLDGLEEVVRHEVGLVGLRLRRRPQLGGRLLRVDHARAPGSARARRGPSVSIQRSHARRNVLSMPPSGARPPAVSPSIVA